MKKILSLLLLLVSITICFAQPAITSFSPTSGTTGSTVTISGSNFSTTAANNIVYFGAVKAQVLSASSFSLSVSVPIGATYKPITVTTGGLTAYSASSFATTYPGGGGNIDYYSFDSSIKQATDLHPNGIVIMDLDGDGKTDIATPNNYSTAGSTASFSVLRNTSAGGIISFASKIDFPNGAVTHAMAAGDVDGDGKPDIVVCSDADNTISVFRNTSTPGNIAFAAKVDFATGSAPFSIVMNDFDKDGKPDIAVANYLSASISVYRNIGSTGSVGFAAPVTLTGGTGCRSLVAADIDKNGKPDLLVANELANSISVIRNTSTAGTISFATKVDFATDPAPKSVAAGDLDGDGKIDIAVAGGNQMGMFRNLSVSGSISLAAKVSYYTASDALYITISDLNGDAKPEVVVAAALITTFKNTSSPGTVVLTTASSYVNIAPYGIASFATEAGDFNGDSKPDLASAMYNMDKVYINRNKLNEPYISSLSSSSAPLGATVGIYGGNFTGATSVSFGGVAASSFTVTNQFGSEVIIAIVGNGNSGDVTVTTPNGTATYPGFVFEAIPEINDVVPLSAGYGQVVTLTGKYFANVTSVKFGSSNAAFTIVSNDTIKATIGYGSSGDVTVTSALGTDTFPGFTFLPTPIIQSFAPARAGRETSVNITGMNFTGTTDVKFGGVSAASFTVVSPTSISALPGNGATGDIRITNAYGTGSATGFTFIPPPAIDTFTPSSGIDGSIITITGNNFDEILAVKVGGVSIGTYTRISSQEIRLQATNSFSSGSIIVTTTGGTAEKAGFVMYKKPVYGGIDPFVGNTGMPVIIYGDNFDGISSITIGGQPVASFTILSPTSIRAIVGAGATGPVIITNPAGSNAPSNSFIFLDKPIITSCNSTAAPAGSIITITGGGFNSVAANNLVSFGTVKAEVVSATMNELKVKVPAAAPFKPIHVINTSSGKMASTLKPFSVKFQADTASFNAASFGNHIKLATAANLSTSVTGDIDGDGRQDLVAVYKDKPYVTIFRNTGTTGNIAFAAGVNIAVDSNTSVITLADLNNDGRQDMIGQVIGDSRNNITVLKNTSTPGSPGFAGYFTIFNSRSDVITTGDFDMDGRIDIALGLNQIIINNFMPYAMLYNNSTGNDISFLPYQPTNSGQINPNASGRISQLFACDLNNDFKIDLAAYTTDDALVLLKGETTGAGLNSFSTYYNPGLYSSYIGYSAMVADFDQDGFTDFVSNNRIFKNPGYLPLQAAPSGAIKYGVLVTDLNGDARADIIQLPLDPRDTSILLTKNTSSGATISFASTFSQRVPATYWSPQAADLDGDSRPELIYIHLNGDSIVILKNQTGAAVLCSGSNTALHSSLAPGTTFQWQVDTGNGFTNLAADAHYSGVNTATLLLTNVAANWYGYQYRCIVDGQAGDIQSLRFVSTFIGASGSAWENPANWSCGVLPDANTDVIIRGGSIVLGASTTVRSLTLVPGANLVIGSGAVLTVVH